MKKLILTTIGTALLLAACGNGDDGRYATFAQCVTSKDVKMYGAFWCPHCQNQKKLFGEKTFDQYINYIECDPRGKNAKPDECLAEKIEGYPTWVFPSGERWEGELPLNMMALKTGCELPAGAEEDAESELEPWKQDLLEQSGGNSGGTSGFMPLKPDGTDAPAGTDAEAETE